MPSWDSFPRSLWAMTYPENINLIAFEFHLKLLKFVKKKKKVFIKLAQNITEFTRWFPLFQCQTNYYICLCLFYVDAWTMGLLGVQGCIFCTCDHLFHTISITGVYHKNVGQCTAGKLAASQHHKPWFNHDLGCCLCWIYTFSLRLYGFPPVSLMFSHIPNTWGPVSKLSLVCR